MERLPIVPASASCCSTRKAWSSSAAAKQAPARACLAAAHEWQMPQGGIDQGEDALRGGAARIARGDQRAASSFAVAEAPDWFQLRPADRRRQENLARPAIAARRRNGSRCASPARTARSTSAIPATGHKPEFDAWRWETIERLPELIVPFKRQVYERSARVSRLWPASNGKGPRNTSRRTRFRS